MNTEALAQIFLLSELAKTIQIPITKIYKNHPFLKIRQSSLAMIFRIDVHYLDLDIKVLSLLKNRDLFLDHIKFKEILMKIFTNEENTKNIFEVLFIQRAINEKDRNSGEIALPGGKCDDDETDFEAVLRETKEEIGFDILNPENNIKYLGKLNKNFVLYIEKSQTLYGSLHIFFDFGRNSLKINPKEIMDFKWIPVLTFIKISKDLFSWQKTKSKYLFRMFSKVLPNNVIINLEKEYLMTEVNTLEIGMNAGVWGLTLEILMHILEIFEESARCCKDKKLKEYFKSYGFFENLKSAIYLMKSIKTKFKNETNLTKKYGKLFDLEYFYLVHLFFGFNSIEKIQKLKDRFDFVIRSLLQISLAMNLMPKF